MSLTNQEKENLRKMICEGYYNSSNNILLKNVTSDILKLVANKSEDEIRSDISEYKNKKIEKLNNDLEKINLNKMQIEALIEEYNER